jgi:glycosyltransferase involved in cell wall biosynthesis
MSHPQEPSGAASIRERHQSKVALVHHWLLAMTGGERVCEAICELFQKPDLFTLFAEASQLAPILRNTSITTSFLQRMPFARKYYRYYAPLFPVAVELFDLRSYALVITSDASVVKGVITKPETCHLCYCYSPMRYAWNMFPEHLADGNALKRLCVAITMHYLRLYDQAAAARVDYIAAISNGVRNRIWKYYRRDSEVIYPPCDVERFRILNQADNYYLCVGRLVGYKRFDLAVKAFNTSGRRLVIAGDGPDAARLKSMAERNIEFLGRLSDDDLAILYSQCKALIFPGEEDFGIVPVEAQASGRPVIAYGKGGALETVIPGRTGLFFPQQTSEALNEAVDEFEAISDRFNPNEIRKNAVRFGKERFKKEFEEYVQRCLTEHRSLLSRSATHE